MKRHNSIALAVLVGLTAFGCATVTPPASQEQSTAQSICRNVASPDGKVNSYCGSAEQWAEFDARTAQVDQGLSCRNVNTSKALCLYAKQWKYADRHLSAGFRDYGFGNEAETNAAMLSNGGQEGMFIQQAAHLATMLPAR